MTDDEGSGLADPGTLVLLGAGASVDVGFPTSKQLHAQLLKRLDPIYGNLATHVFSSDEEVDPERVFRVMEFLNDLDRSVDSFDPALGNGSRDISTLVDRWQPDIAEYLDSRRHRVHGGPLQRTIADLWRTLVDIFSLDAPPAHPTFDYLRHLASQMRGQAIVTLNYDDALERMGFAQTFQIQYGPYPVAPVHGLDPRNAPLRLIKLHGSIEWSRDNATGHVEALPPLTSFRHQDAAWEGRTPAVIFGAGNKLRPDGPYLDLYHEFLSYLQVAQQVVVIGYSFRDAHVNEALRKWFLYQVDDNGLLRVGDIKDSPPAIVESWCQQRRLDVEYVEGVAKEKMEELLRPRPGLMRRRDA